MTRFIKMLVTNYSHLIHEPLLKHLEENNVLNNAQNGFRPKRSTTQTVFQYTSDLYQNLNLNKDTVAVYVDFRKAFDTVSHSTLLKKLKLYKLSPQYLKIIENYLDNRKQLTQINTVTSDLKPVHFGVPQGSILGPTLFILYINDIINVINKCSYYLYADDMVIYTPILGADSMQNVQSDVNAVYKWCNKNKLTINVGKTKAQYFPRNSNIHTKIFESNNPIYINNTKLQYEEHFRHLGIELDHLLSMRNTFDQIYKNASHKLYICVIVNYYLQLYKLCRCTCVFMFCSSHLVCVACTMFVYCCQQQPVTYSWLAYMVGLVPTLQSPSLNFTYLDRKKKSL